MLGNIIFWVILLAVAVAAGYGVWRAWHLKRPALKWSVTPLAGLLTLVLTLAVVLIGVGIVKAYTPRGNPVVERSVASTPERLVRGEHIARVLCSSCHSLVSGELPMSGGEDVLAEVGIPFGVATAPNLTPGGRIDEWSDGELLRVIREGTYPNGHLMTIMSSQTFRVFSQEDLDKGGDFLERDHLGLIAQELEVLFPEAVTEDEATGLKYVAYDMMIVPLVESIKALTAEIEELKARIR